MRIKAIHKIFALTMAFVVMVSSSGLTMDMHYCMGHLKNINVLGKAKTCHDQEKPAREAHCKKMQKKCHNVGQIAETTSDQNGCCNNKSIELKNEADLIPIVALSYVDVDFSMIGVPSICTDQFYEAAYKPQNFLVYKPPNLAKDIPVLFQSFLL